MQRLGLIKNVQINPTFTAADWQLYDTMEGADKVAEILNQSLKLFVENPPPKLDIETAMYDVMRGFSKWGAFDSEPISFLNDIIAKLR